MDGPPARGARGALLYGLPVAGSVERGPSTRSPPAWTGPGAGLSVRIEGADPVAQLLAGPSHGRRIGVEADVGSRAAPGPASAATPLRRRPLALAPAHGPRPSFDERAALSAALDRRYPRCPRSTSTMHGAALDEITRLPEYYLTREEALIAQHHRQLVARAGLVEVAELGAGGGDKLRPILDAARAAGALRRCTLLDISPAALHPSVSRLQAAYPEVHVSGVVGDFLRDLPLLGPGGGRLLLFLGGTFGNLTPVEGRAFLARVAAILEPSDGFVLGLDLVKAPADLLAAYDDAQGVTAAFNRNLPAQRASARISSRITTASATTRLARIEMRLRVARGRPHPQRRVAAPLRYGDEILTEIGCKFDRGRFEAPRRAPGRVAPVPAGSFALVELEPARVGGGAPPKAGAQSGSPQ